MDFRQTRQTPAGNPQPAGAPSSVISGNRVNQPQRGDKNQKWFRLLNFVVLVGVAILVVAIAFAFTKSSSDNEFKYVSASKYQAVFLNNGQVYFGNIDSLNNKYVQLTNVYYLTQNTATSGTAATNQNSGNYTLVKLGCQQIHSPYDQMLINRDQVTFWENLQDSGKVVTSIKAFQKQNPKGPDCSQVSSQTQASSDAATQGTTTPAATTKQ